MYYKPFKKKIYSGPTCTKILRSFYLTVFVQSRRETISKKDLIRKMSFKLWQFLIDLCAIDIFEYDSKLYLTLMDIFSEFPFCIEIASKEQKEVTEAFLRFCALYVTPKAIFSDDGPEFSQI